MCGEKIMARGLRPCRPQSPPRVWGKDQLILVLLACTLITPTCVGKRSHSLPYASGSSNHPHVCGEKMRGMCMRGTPMGSPPRVWGKDKQISRILHLIRITPTCVGKRILGYDRLRGVQDHPHVCGEKFNPPKTLFTN